MVSHFDGAPSGPEALLGVVRALDVPAPPPAPAPPQLSVHIPADQREALARTAAEILRDAGAQTGAGEIIVLAAWLGGMD